MDPMVDDPSSLDGECSRHWVCMLCSIRYFSLTGKARVRITPGPPSSAKTPKFTWGLTWRMDREFIASKALKMEKYLNFFVNISRDISFILLLLLWFFLSIGSMFSVAGGGGGPFGLRMVMSGQNKMQNWTASLISFNHKLWSDNYSLTELRKISLWSASALSSMSTLTLDIKFGFNFTTISIPTLHVVVFPCKIEQ